MVGLDRCFREIESAADVTLATVLEKCGLAMKAQDQADAEASAAWEALLKYCKTWAWRMFNVDSGRYAYLGGKRVHEWNPNSPVIPVLPARTEAAITRLGGIQRVIDGQRGVEQIAWVKKDFLREYQLGPAVEQVRQIADGEARKLLKEAGVDLTGI